VVASRVLRLFLALALVWGGSVPAIELGLAAFPPVVFAGFRYTIGGGLLLIYAAVAPRTGGRRGSTLPACWAVASS